MGSHKNPRASAKTEVLNMVIKLTGDFERGDPRARAQLFTLQLLAIRMGWKQVSQRIERTLTRGTVKVPIVGRLILDKEQDEIMNEVMKYETWGDTE